MRIVVVASAVVALGLMLAACATQPSTVAYDAPGFFVGLLHGFISPVTLVVSIFQDIRIYAFPNAGRWYDAGFVVGAAMIFGGIGQL